MERTRFWSRSTNRPPWPPRSRGCAMIRPFARGWSPMQKKNPRHAVLEEGRHRPLPRDLRQAPRGTRMSGRKILHMHFGKEGGGRAVLRQPRAGLRRTRHGTAVRREARAHLARRDRPHRTDHRKPLPPPVPDDADPNMANAPDDPELAAGRYHGVDVAVLPPDPGLRAGGKTYTARRLSTPSAPLPPQRRDRRQHPRHRRKNAAGSVGPAIFG